MYKVLTHPINYVFDIDDSPSLGRYLGWEPLDWSKIWPDYQYYLLWSRSLAF